MSELNFCKLIMQCYKLELEPEKTELTKIINCFVCEDAPAEQTRQVLAEWGNRVNAKLQNINADAVRQHELHQAKTEQVFGTEV